ncbi:hypothetical protein D3C73_1220800 [compost metagenome]
MVIAEIIDMIVKEGRRNAEFFNPVELILAYSLGMFYPVAGIGTRMAPLGFADGVQYVINGCIAIGMDDHLASG